jgi:hypothetical protein
MKGIGMARIGTRDLKYRRRTERRRAKVFKRAKQQGYITNAEARKLGKWPQAWYHLNVMCEAGYLKQAGHNLWTLGRKRKYELRV